MKNNKPTNSVQGHKDIHLITWIVVLLFVLVLFLFAYISSITGKAAQPSQNDVRLGYLQTLSTCSHNRDCPANYYCQAYNAQGTQITSETPYVEFGLCLPAVKVSNS